MGTAAFVLELLLSLGLLSRSIPATLSIVLLGSLVVAAEVYRLPVFEKAGLAVESQALRQVRRVCSFDSFLTFVIGSLVVELFEEFLEAAPSGDHGRAGLSLTAILILLAVLIGIQLWQRKELLPIGALLREGASQGLLTWQMNALAVYLLFLAAGGETFVGLVLMPALLLSSYLKVTGFERPRGLIDSLCRIIEVQGRLKPDMSSEIFDSKIPSDVVSNTLFTVYPLVIVVGVFNVRFLEFHLAFAGSGFLTMSLNMFQALFLALSFGSAVCAYPAIIQRWSAWKSMLATFGPLWTAMLISLWKPSAMPLAAHIIRLFALSDSVARVLVVSFAGLLLGILTTSYLTHSAVWEFRRHMCADAARKYMTLSSLVFLSIVVALFFLAAIVLDQMASFFVLFFLVVCPIIALVDSADMLTLRDLSRNFPRDEAERFFPRAYEVTPSYTTLLLRSLASPLVFFAMGVLPIPVLHPLIDLRHVLVGVSMSYSSFIQRSEVRVRRGFVVGTLSGMMTVLFRSTFWALTGASVSAFQVLSYSFNIALSAIGGVVGAMVSLVTKRLRTETRGSGNSRSGLPRPAEGQVRGLWNGGDTEKALTGLYLLNR